MRSRSSGLWWGVVLDAPDPHALARFYSALLDWPVTLEDAGGAGVAPGGDSVAYLGFQSCPDYVRPTWPSLPGEQQQMLHLDIEVDDLEAAVGEALALGATVADHQPQRTVRVLLDPAGHPFCLYTDSGAGS
jgi:catechol 2,3-dioxygenase-like lactoylglutathione lyase family enzyme